MTKLKWDDEGRGHDKIKVGRQREGT
jgi:hypothetical protein